MADTKRDYIFIDVTMPDHSVWRVPGAVVADNYAAHFAEVDEREHGLDRQESYHSNYVAILEQDDHLLKWAANTMDWSEVAAWAKVVKPAPKLTTEQMQEAWVNGEKRVVRERKQVPTY